ncbi:hypothetical protein SARC_01194 [Sphaeroforma arctica JP610]|uniref:Uncharacterized protein n=1 Tax=Sphaeroforma arctica JP610 TaxID=667725 RepID=A0A0L0GCD1_9EUKA|nr:hypothetical protein SARC_01194 [Sphaeroforma arctica JP610]KNC86657.1 hypothetical protein SARC_01194 [Sphaeroforma arctica JP610]|eukprot:XP_014160559.1 hypothetical protein SARC_01194 [Sphaeroforma arctica JP610]
MTEQPVVSQTTTKLSPALEVDFRALRAIVDTTLEQDDDSAAEYDGDTALPRATESLPVQDGGTNLSLA